MCVFCVVMKSIVHNLYRKCLSGTCSNNSRTRLRLVVKHTFTHSASPSTSNSMLLCSAAPHTWNLSAYRKLPLSVLVMTYTIYQRKECLSSEVKFCQHLRNKMSANVATSTSLNYLELNIHCRLESLANHNRFYSGLRHLLPERDGNRVPWLGLHRYQHWFIVYSVLYY
jgi:hypothetical protein